MFSKILTKKSTDGFSAQIERLRRALDEADAVVIGAGAGLSTAAGFTYSGERFERYFSDFAAKYGFHDMYSGGFYPFSTQEEFCLLEPVHLHQPLSGRAERRTRRPAQTAAGQGLFRHHDERRPLLPEGGL